MSLKYESPTRYLENGDVYSSCSDEGRLSNHSQTPLNNNIPIVDPELHKEFFNVIQSRQNYISSTLPWTPARHVQLEDLAPINSSALNELMHLNSQRKANITIIDVRAFSFYSQNRIKHAINLSVPSILLKRASYTLDRVCDSVMLGCGERLRKWSQTTHILFYDHSSYSPSDSGNSAITVLVGSKLRQAGYKGKLNYLEGKCNLPPFFALFFNIY
jgi:protein-tyrosine phosphatase